MLRANGLHSAKALSCTARPSARLRGNGSALQRACSCAVYPSTEPVLSLPKCSGRTACNLPELFLAPLALRLGSGGTAVLCRELAPALFTLRQAQGERLAICQGPLLAPLTLWLGSGGTAVLCRELAPALFALRQAQGERSCAVNKEVLSLRQTELSSYVRWGCLNVPLLRCCRAQHVAHALYQGESLVPRSLEAIASEDEAGSA